jgi:RHS repeat-associated protein
VTQMLRLNGTKTFYVYGLGLLHEESGSTISYYHHDRRGDTIALTDATGAVTDRTSYGVYGELLSHTGTTNTPFLFNGKWGVQTDPSGVYYHRARYYHPKLRRFLNQDMLLGSITMHAGLNRFAYANSNPVTDVDPLGLWSPEGHDKLLYAAFYDRISTKDLSTMQQSSREFDLATQNPSQAFMHSMAQGGQSAADAIIQRDAFVSNMAVLAQAAEASGHHDNALYLFSAAAHAIMDSSSPEHVDENGNPKTWAPTWWNPVSWWEVVGHSPFDWMGGERSEDLTMGILHEQRSELNDLYNQVFNAPKKDKKCKL